MAPRYLPLLAAIALSLPGVVLAHDQPAEPGAVRAQPHAPRTIRVTARPDGGVNPWNHLDFRNDPNAFQFAIVSDRTGGARPGIFEDAIRKLNLLQPEFVMSVGDLIEGYVRDSATINSQWNEFQGFIKKLEMPFFYVPGNHDFSNPAMAKVWQQRFGPSYYSFVYRDVLFLCLNSEDAFDHRFSAEQIAWARTTLAAHADVRWTLVFLHAPLWEYDADRGWPALEGALHGRPHTVFAGHYHSYLKNQRDDARYYILASTGGASLLRGPAYGEFDQVAWVTMTTDGPVVANLLLDGILPDDIRTPSTKSDVDALLARVFATDVIWLQEGGPTLRSVELLTANPTDLPVEVVFRLSGAPGISAQLNQGFATTDDGRSTFTLQPKSSRALTVELSGNLPTHAHQAQVGALLAWEGFLQPAGKPRLHLTESLIIPLVPRLSLTKLEKPVVIDGDISDWPARTVLDVTATPFLRSRDEGWTGPADLSFRVAYAHDDAHLYLAVAVKDDNVISRAGMVPWKQDGVEIRIDFRPPAVQRASRVFEDSLLFIGASPAPDDGMDPAYLTGAGDLPPGSRICSRRTADGYIFEASLPLSALKQHFGEQWLKDGLRLNVAVNDRDGDSEEQAQLWWQPDWRGRDNIPGSGTLFFK